MNISNRELELPVHPALKSASDPGESLIVEWMSKHACCAGTSDGEAGIRTPVCGTDSPLSRSCFGRDCDIPFRAVDGVETWQPSGAD